jgi:hypothetical protein
MLLLQSISRLEKLVRSAIREAKQVRMGKGDNLFEEVFSLKEVANVTSFVLELIKGDSDEKC